MNSIMVILPYRHAGMWVFDDESVALVKEPFVAGIDVMIDKLVSAIPNATGGFAMLFSPTPFPDAQVKLEWRREDGGGNWYYCAQYGMEGWLCPALFKYFDTAPNEIYVAARAIEK